MSVLYIVATPIGNLKDITLRAVETLGEVDIIACEDTRHTKKLLTHLGIQKPLISCRSENERQSAAGIVKLLEGGQDVAYVSDAGSPGVSDPGMILVSIVRSAGFSVVPIPGVSAAVALMSVSGFAGKGFFFEGFLSPKQGKRKRRLSELLERGDSFILYESPFRIVKLMRDLADLNSERMVLLGREMTKRYEEFLTGTAPEVLEQLESKTKIAGEIAVLVSGKKKVKS